VIIQLGACRFQRGAFKNACLVELALLQRCHSTGRKPALITKKEEQHA
jgi:hypothetical protein